jgi:penicillin-insensitive murein DD-endopeptidase
VNQLLIAAVGLALATSAAAGQPDSTSVGTPAHGSLQDGVSLPVEGDGFVTYSSLGNWLGRQYVHSRVRDTLVAAFAALHSAQPDRQFVVGETGLRNGGRFRPHRSHQNGL